MRALCRGGVVARRKCDVPGLIVDVWFARKASPRSCCGMTQQDRHRQQIAPLFLLLQHEQKIFHRKIRLPELVHEPLR